MYREVHGLGLVNGFCLKNRFDVSCKTGKNVRLYVNVTFFDINVHKNSFHEKFVLRTVFIYPANDFHLAIYSHDMMRNPSYGHLLSFDPGFHLLVY